MGFFSQNCLRCGHPALSPHVTNPINSWMNNVVVITKNGSVLKGDYDGYGRVGGLDSSDEPVIGGDNTVWHEACWLVAGQPTDYRGASPRSADQGFFYDDPDHDLPDPRYSQS